MKAAELAPLTLSMSEAPRRLKDVVSKFGVAVVTGVADKKEVARLEKLFKADLEELLAAPPKGGAADSKKKSGRRRVVRCEGKTKSGERCAVTSEHKGMVAKYARPLKLGSRFCARHSDASAPLLPAKGKRKPRKGPPLKLSAWPRESVSDLGDGERCSQRGLPQGKFAWACRLQRSVRRCYEVLHGTKDLVTGLDNGFFVPPAAPKAQTNAEWPHVDQNCNDKRVDAKGIPLKKWDCYQGVLYLWPSTDEHASTTVVWPKSHTGVHAKMMADSKCPRSSHFVRIGSLSDSTQRALLGKWRKQARRVPVPAGALVIWNSRTVHQGWSGGPRLAQPVCWEPRERRDAAALERKLRLCALGLPSSHWASLGLPHSMLAGVRLPNERSVSIDGAPALLRSTIEPKALRAGKTASGAPRCRQSDRNRLV